MTEQKRPVLTLKRKTEGETLVRSRKTIINVTTPPKWKVKKQKLAEKAAREAELAAKKAQARQALSIYLNLPTLDDAVNTLKPWWPGLFDGDTPRLLACGIRDVRERNGIMSRSSQVLICCHLFLLPDDLSLLL